MDNIYVLTPELDLAGVIDEYVSCIWRPSYAEVGDFELYLAASDKAVGLLQRNRYLVRGVDISVGESANMLEIIATSQTINGVEFTVNDDGSITANGTASSDGAVLVLNHSSYTLSLKNGKYAMCGCPIGGSKSSYRMQFWNYDGNKTTYTDYGTGATFDFTNEGGEYNVAIIVFPDATVDNVTFYPELRKQEVATYKKVMVIKNIQLVTDVENGDFLTVTGRELKFLFHQRIVWSDTRIEDTVEYVLRRLMGFNAIDPVEPARAIPNMQHAEPKGYGGETITVQSNHVPLDEALTSLCNTYGYGWDIYITDNMLTAEVYKGVDRSYNQSERPYVVFSDEFENLHDTSYEMNSEGYANMALVSGEDGYFTTVNNELSGLDRYEIYVDGSNISQNLDSEDEALTTEEYDQLLVEAGTEALSAKTLTVGFGGELLSDVSFTYGEDFYLGDIVTVINKYGITKNVRVLSVIESEDADGFKLLPQFNI